MALQKKEDNFYGHTQDTYMKIGGVLVRETGKDEEGKLYSAELQLDWYTNETKAYHFNQNTETLQNLREEELNLTNYYSKLSVLDRFKDFINA